MDAEEGFGGDERGSDGRWRTIRGIAEAREESRKQVGLSDDVE